MAVWIKLMIDPWLSTLSKYRTQKDAENRRTLWIRDSSRALLLCVERMGKIRSTARLLNKSMDGPNTQLILHIHKMKAVPIVLTGPDRS